MGFSDAIKILVVEDEALIAMDLEALLTDAGYEVVGPVGTVIAALEIISESHITAAILDANLNGESSSMVASKLSASNVPYVLVTGCDTANLPLALQTAIVIQKPYDSKRLLLSLALVASTAVPLRPKRLNI